MNQHINDVNAKIVFGNSKLCAQFLRDYVNIPEFKDITDGDIEDVTERYNSYFGVEYNADTVKKVRIRPKGEELDVYIISLVDHKSKVDYNVSMQLLKYMVCIWSEYEKVLKADGDRRGITGNKSFRYPPILPIVYYEGKVPWTAGRDLKERIMLNDVFEKFIPNYEYIVVRGHDFSNDELLEKKDEMSLIMLLNKIQTVADLSEFMATPVEQLDEIIKESPKEVLDIIVAVMRSLCERINITDEEKEDCVRKVVNREMGYLFENMDKIDVQAERRRTEEQRRKTEEERRKTEEERRKTEEERCRADALQIELNVFKLTRQGKDDLEIAKLMNLPVDRIREILKG